MRLVRLPAIRLSRVQERVGQIHGMTYEKVGAVMQIIEDELEADARRIGSLCPKDGCNHILTPGHDTHQRYYHCPEHGHFDSWGGLPLVIAFDPISADAKPQASEVSGG